MLNTRNGPRRLSADGRKAEHAGLFPLRDRASSYPHGVRAAGVGWVGGLARIGMVLGVLLLSGCGQTSAEHLAHARKFLSQDKYRSALIEFKNVLQKTPDNAEARFGLGRAYLAMGDAADAEEQFQRAAKLGEPASEVVVPLARSQIEQGKYDKALALMRAHETALQGQMAPAATVRGDALFGKGLLDAAEAAYERAIADQPGYAPARVGQAQVLMARRDTAGALKQVQAAIASDGGDAPAWMLRGRIDARQHNWKEASAAFEKVATGAVKHRSNNAMRHEARLRQADIEIGQGQIDAARAKIAALLKAMPNQPVANFLQARIDVHDHRLDDAANHLQTALQAHSRYLPALVLLGAVKLEQHQSAQAQMYLSSAAALDPNNDRIRQLLARAELGGPSGGTAQLRKVKLTQPTTAGAEPDLSALENRASKAPRDAMAQFTLAQSLLEKGETDRALTVLDQMPDSADATGLTRDRLRLAAYLRAGKLPEARKAVDEMIAAHAKEPQAYVLASDVYMIAGDNAKARSAIEKARHIAPHDPHVLLTAAVLAMRTGNRDTATADFKTLLVESPRNVRALMGLAELAAAGNDAKQTEQWLKKAVQAAPKAMATHAALIRLYILEKQPDKALDAAQAAVAAAPGNADALNLLGAAQWAGGQRKAALGSFEKAVAAAPDNMTVRMHLAQIQATMKDSAAAQKTLEAALKQQPANAAAARLLAVIQFRAGDRKAAFATADALAKQPGSKTAATELKGDLQLLGGQYAEADRTYQSLVSEHASQRLVINDFGARLKASVDNPQAPVEQWLTQHPKDVRVRSLLAQWYLQNHRLDAASGQYEQIVAQNGRDASALNNLAWIYGQQNNPKALDMAQRAHKAAPDNPQILDTLGWLQLQAGHAGQALANLEQAASSAKGAPSIEYHLAVAQSRTGHIQAAQQLLDHLLAQKTPFPERDKATELMKKLKKS